MPPKLLPCHIVMLGPFALAPKATMSTRALQMAETLTERGHRVTMILPPWDDPAQSGRSWNEGAVHIRNIALPRRAGAAGIVFRLAAAVRAAKPDVIHLFKPKGHAALAALALRRHYPLVVDTDDWEGRGGWNDVNRYSRLQRTLAAWQEGATPRRAAATTVASRTLETQVWGFGVPRERVCYLPNGVTAKRHGDWAGAVERAPALRAALGLGDAPTILLYTRFVEFAPARVVDFYAAVRRVVPAARLLVIGRGFRGEERALLDGAQRAGVGDGIVHLPWLEREDLPAGVALGDVAILPYDDTLINRAKCSVKTLDLMVAARPIVADAVGQNRDYLEGGRSGILVAPDDPAAFAPAVVELLRDEGQRRALGAAARERVWRDFDWARLIERAESTYALALASRSHGTGSKA